MPLSVLRGDRAPGAKWLPSDGALMVALTIYESSLCHECGHDRSKTHAERGDFVAATVTCLGCAAIERYKRDEKPGPGEKVYAVDDSERDD